MNRELDPQCQQRVTELSAAGDVLVDCGRFEEALNFYASALSLVPDPKDHWEAATWLQCAIGDAYFLSGNWTAARTAFLKAVVSVGGLGNPFIHLRLGQIAFECGELATSADELARAFMAAGEEVFEGSDSKYLKFLKQKLSPPGS